ncbi:MAG: hypothetical protein OXE84_10615 [Rhodobacteraceae bacterium]|nr:hypothetical protein [Paracoccaceae bacterium]MCY4196488.1 hypothetical protein [Paracoccaceae bacterium]MCY4327525.1 hypothetical protein [Paracoccaceae bacterium]
MAKTYRTDAESRRQMDMVMPNLRCLTPKDETGSERGDRLVMRDKLIAAARL